MFHLNSRISIRRSLRKQKEKKVHFLYSFTYRARTLGDRKKQRISMMK